MCVCLGGFLRGCRVPGWCGSCRQAISATSVPSLFFSLPLSPCLGDSGIQWPTVLKVATGAGPALKMLMVSLCMQSTVSEDKRVAASARGVWKERPRSTKCLHAPSELSLEDQTLLCGQTSGEGPSGISRDGVGKHFVPVCRDWSGN